MFNSTFKLHALITLLILSACSQAAKQTSTTLLSDSKKVFIEENASLISTTPPVVKQPQLVKTTQDPFLQGLLAKDIARAQASVKKHILPHWQHIMQRSIFVRQRLINTLKRMHAPLSLQLIPVVESSYRPYALSRTGAMGLWQLMPATAQALGIKSNPYRDGRRNIEESTRAAVRYLQTQYQRFGNWPLAFAAYNMGPNGLARRLKKSPWVLHDGLENMPIPTETRNYVRHIIGLTALLNMKTITFPDAMQTQAITLQAPVDLKQLSNIAKLPDLILFKLNPGLHYSQYLQHNITIHTPVDSPISQQAVQAPVRPRYIHIKIQSGDSLWKLARQHHSSVAQLKELNPKLSQTLKIGAKITVPAYSLARATATTNPMLTQGRRIHYKVRKGDSLWSISRRFGTSTRAISRNNQLSRNSIIRPGDRLWIIARI
ncbi:MAG: transglycosylase SLT domain-containing protein [Mariprofundaceae bacterium]|nr:transglycosylase SLT domain-containing protein [Mariprofundaceae bacterium]